MKNVKLVKSIKGWFLTIGKDNIKNTWAVESLELWALKKMIEDSEKIILKEIDEK